MDSCLIEYILTHWYGEREVSGQESNPRILKIQQKYAPWVRDDNEIAWCAMFMTWIFEQMGHPLPKALLAARDFLEVGDPVDKPALGDLVIYSRGNPDGWKGHVGVYIRHDGDKIWTLGGNQADAVTISAYSESRLLGYRRTVLS